MEGTDRRQRGLRRLLGIGLGVVMIVALAPSAAAQAPPEARSTDNVCEQLREYDRDWFEDTRGSAHERNILCMADFGLTEGLQGGDRFGPRLDVNRGQMASFIARFIEDYTGEDLELGARFRDVPNSYVHADNIRKLANINVTAGTRGGQDYAPLARVTRAQMASFISRALTYFETGEGQPEVEPPRTSEDYFSDDDGNVHEANIDALTEVGIVQGFADGTYRPASQVKRDQMASFVMRAYDYAVEEELGLDYEVFLSWEEEVTDAGVRNQGQPNAEGYAWLGIYEATNRIEVAVDYEEVNGPFGAAPGFHIHRGARNANGPIVVTLATGAELQRGLRDAGGFLWTTVDVPRTGPNAFDVSELLDDPESFYLNLHSNAYPAGAIRGQLPDG
jgi:hypothetical protein